MGDEEQSGDGQDRGVTPQRKPVKYSNVIILVVCGCMVTDGSGLDPDWHFPSDKC